jgi:hypothetical protein
MRVHRSYLLALVTLATVFFAIPAFPQKVVTDYDHSADFTRYHTYSWGHIHASDPLFEQRMREAIDHALQSKGWQEVPDGGDATVTAISVRRNKHEYTTFYDGFGPRWGWHGWGTGMATTTVEDVPMGTLIVDLYDTNSERLVWRGEARMDLSDNPEKDTGKLQKAAEKMFNKFPPKSAQSFCLPEPLQYQPDSAPGRSIFAGAAAAA